MAEFEVSRSMPAVREVVFAEATRLQVGADWLPQPAQTGAADQLEADAPQLRLEWGTPGSDAPAGWLAVEDRDAGASEVTVHLVLPDAGGEDVEARLEQWLDRLYDSVLQRVTDAS